ncbi:voltage-dependent anion channel-domain-containing protein [Daldinia vernicosa]|uniref:voltage-dependent anion channel-domain-containing protein n=1 Tax=Daldinia vernicosa TaxID=114800 RepID=UPI002008D182|nr:voltage-dependent anion channel-domain-containing protein [Daldinia vernicosa]KAI0850330.1 voltage-dependent anion channel-domain-containing protein [Daldinia vernicosa]
MDKSITPASDKITPFLTDHPPLFATSLEKHTPGPNTKYEVDERDISLSTSGTRVNSPDASIHDGKEGHDIEKMEAEPDGIDIYDPDRPRFKLSQRLAHFTWAWFTFPMSTGGLALLIYAQPHQFPGLRKIGFGVYITNIVIFASIVAAMIMRFVLHKGTFKTSITHSREAFFVPTLFLAIATIITGTQRYAIPEATTSAVWFISALFWGYVVASLFVAIAQYSYVFRTHQLGLQTMMPTWILPIFPIMLSGTIASVIAETQPQMNAIPIIVVGLTCQGLGLSVAFMMYAHMVGRLMSRGMPNREHRAGLFMNVGPPAFTALAIIGMANGLPDNLDINMGMVLDMKVIRPIAVVGAIFLWALSLWWFGIAVVSVIMSPPQYFHLNWWAMAFPNTGFILATISIGNELQHEVIRWIATGMSICLLLTYCFVFYNLVRAVIIQDIMYPGRDEDVLDTTDN